MNCDECRPLLSAQLDREVPVEMAQAVGDHLSACPSCRREQESLSALKQATSRMPLPKPPDALESAIRSALSRAPEPISIRRLALAATAAAAITVSLFIGLRPDPSHDSREFVEAVALAHRDIEQKKVMT